MLRNRIGTGEEERDSVWVKTKDKRESLGTSVSFMIFKQQLAEYSGCFTSASQISYKMSLVASVKAP